jgi:Xaa-Pro aminopeptidase
MLFTVEPGIYLAGWGGIRLENMAVVTRDGVEVLNNLESSDFLIDV